MPKTFTNTTNRSLNLQYDVIVVGAGSGGIAAAIQAARLNAKTLLIEPSRHIGGQLLVVPTMDEGFVEGEGFPIRKVGLYAEFIERIRKVYQEQGKSVGTCYWQNTSIGFEPQTAEQVLTEMLTKETKVSLILETTIDSIITQEQQVVGITTTDNQTFHCKVLIDATEYGDLIPLTPARYRVGNATSDDINLKACLQDITYPAVIEKYPGGAPKELVIHHPPPKFEDYLAQFTATFNKRGFNWYQNNCGENQDQPCWGKYPANWITHHTYRGLPNSNSKSNYSASFQEAEHISKTVINWANDYSVKASYLEDVSQRENDNNLAKLKTINFLYYLQQQLGEEWAISDTRIYADESKTSHLPPEIMAIGNQFPPYPYVRESRRIVPLRTLTGGDIKRVGYPPRAAVRFSQAVAVGYYPADLHGCQEDSSFNPALESGSDIPEGFISGPFQIPLEALIPEKVDGFLAAEKNIGVSRIVNGATRLGPITMVIGQAVGTLAGLAAIHGLQPRQVDPLAIQLELIKDKFKLSLHAYQDVPQSHPYWPAVEMINTHELLERKTRHEFGITEHISRAELVKALCILQELDISSPPPTPSFLDVEQNQWYHPYIEAIHTFAPFPPSKIGKDRFYPTDPISREDMDEIIISTLQGTDFQGVTQAIVDGSRKSGSNSWLEKIKQGGIICEDHEGKLNPRDLITKGEAALIFYALLLEKAQDYSPDRD